VCLKLDTETAAARTIISAMLTQKPADTPAPDNEERLRFAIAVAQMGVFEWDVNSDVLTWFGTTGLGLKQEEAPTSGRAFFEIVHPDDRQLLGETRDRAIRARTDTVVEFRTISSDGLVHWVQAHGRVVYAEDGKPLRIHGVNTDVTYRKSLEEQVREAHSQVERLRILKATMRTVQDIVSNALMSLQLFRDEAEPHVSSRSVEQFDRIISETTAKLKALGDLENVVETTMVLGAGIDYQSRLPRVKP
jgi:PAS domain S-box-containing protein